MSKIILKPSHESLIVRDPITKKILSKKGEPKTLNTFWRRRLLDGSVLEVKKIIENLEVDNGII